MTTSQHRYLSLERQAELKATAQALLAPYKGILAADEATPAMGQRLAGIGVENTEENRRRYRQIIFATPKEDLAGPIAGVILQHETCYQKNDDGISLLQLLKVTINFIHSKMHCFCALEIEFSISRRIEN